MDQFCGGICCKLWWQVRAASAKEWLIDELRCLSAAASDQMPQICARMCRQACCTLGISLRQLMHVLFVICRPDQAAALDTLEREVAARDDVNAAGSELPDWHHQLRSLVQAGIPMVRHLHCTSMNHLQHLSCQRLLEPTNVPSSPPCRQFWCKLHMMPAGIQGTPVESMPASGQQEAGRPLQEAGTQGQAEAGQEATRLSSSVELLLQPAEPCHSGST